MLVYEHASHGDLQAFLTSCLPGRNRSARALSLKLRVSLTSCDRSEISIGAEQLLAMSSDAAAGVSFVHDNNIVHSDISAKCVFC